MDFDVNAGLRCRPRRETCCLHANSKVFRLPFQCRAVESCWNGCDESGAILQSTYVDILPLDRTRPDSKILIRISMP
jgi:hypothetical protein